MSLSALFPTLEHPGLQIGSGTHKALFSRVACALMVTPSLALLMDGRNFLTCQTSVYMLPLSREMSVANLLKDNPACSSPSPNDVCFLS